MTHLDRWPVLEALDSLSEGEWQDVLVTLEEQALALRLVIPDPHIDILIKSITDALKS